MPRIRTQSPAIALILVAVVLASCTGGGQNNQNPGGQTPIPPTATSEPSGPVITWDKSPETIIVRLDRVLLKEPPYDGLNRLPSCTLFGNGRLLWINNIPPNGEEVLEAYLDDVTIRGFLEYVIRDKKFYNSPDYASQELPPSENAPLESVTLNVSQELRTVRSYRRWPDNLYLDILDKCRTLTETRALYIPTGAWVTGYAVPDNPNAPKIGWPPTGPFKMAELAASGNPMWVTDVALTQLWTAQRQSLGQIYWLEGGKTYRVAIQVPGVSRDSPPAPVQTEATATPDN
jgi:hypothetical protein